MYKKYIKRIIDVVLSAIGIVVLAIPMLIVAIMIKIDSPGPVIFKQRRIGIQKTEFAILKFRSMPVNAPKDVPTHEFNAADMLSKFQITMRRFSIDEIPQIFNIFMGHMSIVGPRPALWNQEDLIEERDKYGANDIRPGLTGLAQINGRDELDIPVKAKLDGEYTAALNAGEIKGILTDVKCLLGTIRKVLKSDGVLEGGTGSMQSKRS